MFIKSVGRQLTALVLPLSVCFMFSACGTDEPESSDGDGNEIELPGNGDDNNQGGEPTTPPSGSAMSPLEQKELLDQIAVEFMQKLPSNEFSEYENLGNYISRTYTDDYDWENVEDWASEAFDASCKAIGTHQETEKETYGNYTYTYNYIYSDYSALLMASNFTGHFTAKNGEWQYSKADDLQFIFNDQLGRQCVLKLATSGDVKKVHAFKLEDWVDYDYSSSNNNTTYNDYIDVYDYTIGVPSKIVVSLTQGGNEIINTSVNIDLSSISGEEFDICKSSISLSTVTTLSNGYKVNVSKVAYTGNSKASASVVISKNGEDLVTTGVSGDVNGLPSVNVSAFFSEDFDEDDYNWDNANGKNAYVKVDIMGKLQIQGRLSDVVKFADYLEAAYDYEENESMFKSYINQANALGSIYLYYNNSEVKQADVAMEAFVDDTWNGITYWTAEPVLKFYDGSSYSTFEAFFNDVDFKTTIRIFENLVDDYAAMFE